MKVVDHDFTRTPNTFKAVNTTTRYQIHSKVAQPARVRFNYQTTPPKKKARFRLLYFIYDISVTSRSQSAIVLGIGGDNIVLVHLAKHKGGFLKSLWLCFVLELLLGLDLISLTNLWTEFHLQDYLSSSRSAYCLMAK